MKKQKMSNKKAAQVGEGALLFVCTGIGAIDKTGKKGEE